MREYESFESYLKACRVEAVAQWGDAELVDNSIESARQAFANGLSPSEFVQWLGDVI